MSAWSDWKCGAINDNEYKFAMMRECADNYYTDDPDDPYWDNSENEEEIK